MENNTAIFTTAEVGYDYQYTRVVDSDVGTTSNGKTIRKVRIPDSRINDQCGRYHSGMHMAVDQVEFDKIVKFELVKVTPKASVDEFLARGETD